jgi:hypothetical protein
MVVIVLVLERMGEVKVALWERDGREVVDAEEGKCSGVHR